MVKRPVAVRCALKSYKDAVQSVEVRTAATGQTAVRMRVNESPIKRLIRLKKLCAQELSAAEDIVRAFEMQIGAPHVPDVNLGVSSSTSATGADTGEVRRLDLTQHYMRWRRELARTPELTAAVAMLLDQRAARDVDAELGRRKGTAEKCLIRALRHMAVLRGNAPRDARGWRLTVRGKADRKRIAV